MKNWSIYFQLRRNKINFLVSVFLLVTVLVVFLNFLTYAESRQGFVFHDPVLELFAPLNISFFTFLVTYSIAITGIVIALRTPATFTGLLLAYAMMTAIRMLCLFLLPLEPPEDIIPLYDVFLKFSFYSGRDNLKDLFFSGHTATIFLFAFAFEDLRLKRLFFTGAVIVAIMVVLQHVHYSIDVVAAPLVSFVVVKFLQRQGLFK